MTLDTLLNQPLAAVRDDGFSAAVVLRLHRAEERRRLLLWGATALALLPPLMLLPLAPAGGMLATALTHLAASPVFASSVGVIVLLWAFRPQTRF